MSTHIGSKNTAHSSDDSTIILSLDQLDCVAGGAKPANSFLAGGVGQDSALQGGQKQTSILFGGSGNDLLGNRGNDVLIGDEGRDLV